MSADDGPGTREVARRLFAAEYEDADLSYSESDEERAPNFVVTPTGARVNRLFVVGVLTETEQVNEDMVRARVVDPTGAFVAYAGQYQPDELAFFERATPPEFVALTGKARTFQPEDSDRVYTSVRPESVTAVDAETRDRWTVSAAEATLRRVDLFADALDTGLAGEELASHLREAGVEAALAEGVPRAADHYGTTAAYLEAVRRTAVDALAVVAGDREEVRSLDLAPDEGGDAELGPVPGELTVDAGADEPTAAAGDSGDGPATAATGDAATVGDRSGDDAATGAGGDAATAGGDADAGTTEPAGADAGGVAGAASDPGGSDATGAARSGDGEAAAADDGGLGDFDPGDGSAGDLDDEMYEFDEEERREVQEEYGVEFESGAEVDDPGEAGIDTPGTGAGAGDDAAATEGPRSEPDGESAGEGPASAGGDTAGGAGPEPDAGGEGAEAADEAEEPAADAGDEVDLETAAVEAMDDLDDGDGADRERVVAAVVDEYGADPGAVEDAIQEALMDGRCYEPGEDRLKAI